MFASRQVAKSIFMAKRNFMRSAIRRHGHDEGGEPGKNLPFDIHNRYKLTLLMTVFIATGMAIPFIAVRHQLLK